MQLTRSIASLLCACATAACAEEMPTAVKPITDNAPAAAIKSWKPLPGEQFEVAGRKAPVIRPEKPAAGNPGRG